ncbi:MAG TPA: hypothetical protein ENJ82_05665 [Bacteroidetes bacterium]|nr:hypothetical protein [Bacteroidota bacterium]
MNEFLDKIEAKLTELATLQIVTVVGDVHVQVNGMDVSGITIDENSAMVTRLDMLAGDHTTYYDKAFVTGEYASLRAYHAKQEANGLQRVKSNISALRKIIQLAREVKDEKARTTKHVGETGAEAAGKVKKKAGNAADQPS